MPGLWCVILCVVYKSLSFLGLNISSGFLFQWHSVMFGFCSIRSVVKYQHKGQFKQEPTHTQTETHSRCLRNTQPHQGRGYNRFLTWINVDMFLFPEPKLFFFFLLPNSGMDWMEILRCRLVRAPQLPRSIGQSCSRTRQRSTDADGSASGAGSNSLICKGPDSRHKLTGGAGESTSTPVR